MTREFYILIKGNTSIKSSVPEALAALKAFQINEKVIACPARTSPNLRLSESFQTNIVEQAGGKLWNFNKTDSVDFKKNASILTAEDKTEARFSHFC